MRIVFVNEFFQKQMGYLANCLPKYLARAGAEVHVITTDLPPYSRLPSFRETYAQFIARAKTLANTSETVDGFTLHTLPHKPTKGLAYRVGTCRIVGLREKLGTLAPDIVQSWGVQGWVPIDVALAKRHVPFHLFTANHTHQSVFPLAQPGAKGLFRRRVEHAVVKRIPARWVGSLTKRCYCISEDCAQIAIRYFGTPARKAVIAPLGTDTEFFWPVRDEGSRNARIKFRAEHGVSDKEILCVYTGRLTEDKNPQLLAEAVARLRAQGLPFRSLFVGSGPQQSAIAALDGAAIRPLVPFWELGEVYRAADIAVWPTQESMSMIDAAACGIPIIVNDTALTKERIDGNGLTYQLGDVEDLARVLGTLADSKRRLVLGKAGGTRIPRELGWNVLADRRLKDYAAVLGS